MMSRPGDNKIERAAACDCFFEIAGEDLMKLLQSVHSLNPVALTEYSQHQCIHQHKLSHNDSRSLEVDRLPAVVVEVSDLKHLGME